MKYIKTFAQLDKNDFNIAGGKGASLGEMMNNNIAVPDGYVVTAATFDYFLEKVDLIQEIKAILKKVDHNTLSTIESASEKIQALIHHAEMPDEIAEEILSQYKILDSEYVAVRSSATAEDGVDHAWAGQLDSYLNVSKDKILRKVQDCWASLFTPRAIFYRFEKGLESHNISVAVVIQKMINSEKSGIAFSVHPITEDTNQIIIEAGLGLGEAIVSGSITPDSYVVEKDSEMIVDINVNSQTQALYRSVDGESEWQDLDKSDSDKQVLTGKEILALSKIILNIESHYGFPCDIEWAYENNKFYITQSRPITTLTKNNISKKISYELVFKEYHPPMWLYQWVSPVYLEEYKKMSGVDVTAFYSIQNNQLSGYMAIGSSKSMLGSLQEKLGPNFFKNIQNTYEYELNRLISVKKSINSGNLSKEELLKQVSIVSEATGRIYPISTVLYVLSESLERQMVLKGFNPHEYIKPFKNTTSQIAKKELRQIYDKYVINSNNTPQQLYIKNEAFKKEMNGFAREYGILTSLNMGIRDAKSFFGELSDIANDTNESLESNTVPFEIKKDIEYLNNILFYKDEISSLVVPFVKFGLIDLWGKIAKLLGVHVGELEQLHMDEINSSFLLSQEVLKKKIMDRRKSTLYINTPKDGLEIYQGEIAKNRYEFLMENNVEIDMEEGKRAILKGKIGSKGCVKGVVQIISDISHISEFSEGNILVASYTAPEFVPIMRKAKAIITDVGGATSHAAIVSRELGIPCVVGTKYATTLLVDKQIIEVNANEGRITVLE